jgi:RNA polymerase sigma-70 factor (ECF subfamily)
VSDLSFDEWYPRVRPGLLTALSSWCGDPGAASDAIDEAFVRAVERWPKVSQMSSPEGWVWRTAANVVRRRLRRQAVEARVLRHHRRSEQLEPRDPDLLAALQQLSERQRTAVVLHHVADRPVAEIAEMLGVAPGTVTATLHQARTRLAELLGPHPMSEPTTTRIDGVLP